MSQPVNLNRYKKQKARVEKKTRAEQNAVLHGLPKAARDLAKAQQKQQRALLAQKHLTSDADTD